MKVVYGSIPKKCQNLVIVPILLLKQCRKIWTNQFLLNGMKNILGEVSENNGHFLHYNRIFFWNPFFHWGTLGFPSTLLLKVTYTVPYYWDWTHGFVCMEVNYLPLCYQKVWRLKTQYYNFAFVLRVCETWLMEENGLRGFETVVIREIFGPKREG